MNPLIFILIGVFAGANVKLPHWVKPVPDTSALVAAQQHEADAKAQLAQAQAKLDDLQAKKDADTSAQLTYAHQMNRGAADAIKASSLPLAAEFVAKVDAGLTAARGAALTPEQLDEVDRIVQRLVSPIVADRDLARADLAKKDAELAVATKEKVELAVQVAQVSGEKAEALKEVAATAAEVHSKTAEVVQWVKAKTEGDAAQALLQRWIIEGVAGLGLMWVLVYWIWPSFAQDHKNSSTIQWLYKKSTGLTCGHEVNFAPAIPPKQ